MGAIFEAEHARLPKRFAIKLLSLSHNDTAAEAYARFRREAQITAELGHPHIVEIVDFNQSEEGQPYFVMELLEGQDLAQRVIDGPALSIAEVAQIVDQSAQALQVAHDRGIVHRDVKPSNIFLARRKNGFEIKVLDFGISKVRNAADAITRGHPLIGTVQWMSPEQTQPETKTIDHRSDIFSLAAVTYLLLTKRPPFLGDDFFALVAAIREQPEQPASTLVPSLPTSVDEVLAHALQKDPDARHQSVEAFAADLRRALRVARDTLGAHRSWLETGLQRLPAVQPMRPIALGNIAVDQHATTLADQQPGAHAVETERRRSKRMPLILTATTLALLATATVLVAVGLPRRTNSLDDAASAESGPAALRGQKLKTTAIASPAPPPLPRPDARSNGKPQSSPISVTATSLPAQPTTSTRPATVRTPTVTRSLTRKRAPAVPARRAPQKPPKPKNKKLRYESL